MTINNSTDQQNEFDENDVKYISLPRRQEERRAIGRRAPSLMYVTHEKVRQLRKLSGNSLIPLRESDRRKLDRRFSSPTLLSFDDIARLRLQKN